MKWGTMMYHLTLAGVVFNVQISGCTATSAPDVFSQSQQSAKVTEIKKTVSKENKGNEKGETDSSLKKREIPDALVDHPEDFESSREEILNDIPTSFVRELSSGDLPIIEAPGIEVDDYIYYGERKKRDAGQRSKRKARQDEEDMIEALEIMKNDNHHHHHHHHDQHDDEDEENLEWDEETVEASDRAANAVLEALGYGKNSAKYWPEGPSSSQHMVPIAKVRIPLIRRPAL